MSTAVKVGIGIAATLSALAVGGTAISTGIFANNEDESGPVSPSSQQPRTPVSKKSYKSQSSVTGEGKFGTTYRPFLVSTTDNSNDNWWNTKYESVKSSLGSGAFQSISDANGLKNKCKEAYEQKYKDSNTSGFESGQLFTITDVFKYCSSLGSIPKKLTDDTTTQYPANSIAKSTTDNTYLVSTTGNDEFWKAKNDEFYELDKLKRPNVDSCGEDDHFKNGRKQNKDIKDLCEKAYKKASDATRSDGSCLSASTVEYCKFEYPTN